MYEITSIHSMGLALVWITRKTEKSCKRKCLVGGRLDTLEFTHVFASIDYLNHRRSLLDSGV